MSFEDEVEYFSAYDAGKESRQEEVDKLQAEVDELQKRIDLCVGYIEDNHLNEKDLVLLIYGCLKGEENENSN